MAFQTACKVTDLAQGDLKAVNVGGTKVVLYRLDDGFYATQSSCTHVFVPLGRGTIVDGCKVQCPLHRARFDIRTGKVVDWANWPPGIISVLNAVRGEKDLKTYAVRVQGDELQVDV